MLRGSQHSEEARRKISIARSRYLEENENAGSFSDVAWYRVSNILGEEYIVRGLLERDLAELLNTEERLWVRKVYLTYYDSDGNYHTYAPDFYLPEEDLYLEAKGYFSDEDKHKLNLVVEQNSIGALCVVFDLWADVDRSTYLPGSKRRRGSSAVRQAGHVSYVDCVKCGIPTRSSKGFHDKCAHDPAYVQSTKIDWPEFDTLLDNIRESNIEAVSRNLGVSGNAIRKRLRRAGLDYKEVKRYHSIEQRRNEIRC